MLNPQVKRVGGEIISRGIEWTDYTWNVIGGCRHRCRWTMPDGSVARCYAEAVAEGVARAAYPEGFAHHYWHPNRLEEPLGLDRASKIFLDSMSDLGGSWVPRPQAEAVLGIVARARKHKFQLLTKAAPTLRRLELPPNLWAGVSMPPDEYMRQALSREQQTKMLHVSLDVLAGLSTPVRWMSFEPLSWDVSEIVRRYPGALTWAVIGAATNGQRVYPPDQGHVRSLLDVLAEQRVPVFFKGNLKGHAAGAPWTEFFPEYVPTEWNEAPVPPWAGPGPESFAQTDLFGGG